MGGKSKRRGRQAAKRVKVTARTIHAARVRDQRGRNVAQEPEAYEEIAASRHYVGYAMVAGHNVRMERTQRISPKIRLEAMSILSSIGVMDEACRGLGASASRPPSVPGRTWPDHLAWALDSAVATVRLLLAGQIVGAAAVARNQLERWTANRAHLARVRKESGESDADYITRVWTSPVDPNAIEADPQLGVAFEGDAALPSRFPDVDHAHVTLTDGREICPALMWSLLSEILHGRGPVGAARWEIVDRLDPDRLNDDVAIAVGAVVDAAAMYVAHIRRILEAIHLAHGWIKGAEALRNSFDSISAAGSNECVRIRDASVPDHTILPDLASYMPLLPNEGLHPRAMSELRNEAFIYGRVMKGERPHRRLYKDDEFIRLAFTAHRYRSALTAKAALAREQKMLGRDFKLRSLDSRGARWTLVAEAMGLLGAWTPQPQMGDAAVTASSALRSASWLWLEDDDRAMAALRCALEQTARVRTWRRRPARAEQLERLRNPSPNRWLESAGWKRLTPLSKALGQFAHMNEGTDWAGARDLLAQLQLDADSDNAIYTARRSALELTEEVMAREAVEGLKSIAPATAADIARDLADYGLRLAEFDPNIERHLDHVWEQNAPGRSSST